MSNTYDYNGVTIYGREVWDNIHGDSVPGVPTKAPNKDNALFLHYSAFGGMDVETLKEQIAVMRAIRHHHVEVNGWADIGYSWVLFQPYGTLRRARLFKGRGMNRVPASQYGCNQGTNGRPNPSVCVVALNEPVKAATLKQIRDLYRALPVGDVKGHRDCGNTTACPGNALYAKLPVIRQAK